MPVTVPERVRVRVFRVDLFDGLVKFIHSIQIQIDCNLKNKLQLMSFFTAAIWKRIRAL